MKMIDFAKETRTTEFFREMEISKVKIAYRIMEYLRPDENFPPKTCDWQTMELLNNNRYIDAYYEITDNELKVSTYSSYWGESIKKEAIELMMYLQNESEKSKNIDTLEKSIERAQNELNKLKEN